MRSEKKDRWNLAWGRDEISRFNMIDEKLPIELFGKKENDDVVLLDLNGRDIQLRCTQLRLNDDEPSENISHPIHFFPRDVRTFDRIWNVVASFSNDFKVSDNGIYNQTNFSKFSKVDFFKVENILLYRFQRSPMCLHPVLRDLFL